MFKLNPILFSEDGSAGAGGAGASDTSTAGAGNGADISALTEKLTALENNSKKLVEEKRALETELKGIKDAELLKTGNLQTLLDNTKAELEKLKPEVEALRQEKADRIAEETKEKEELMRQLPTDEDREFAEGYSLAKLRKFVAKTKKTDPIAVDKGNAVATATLTDAQKKSAREMFPYLSEQRAYEDYIYILNKTKKKD